MPGDRRVVRAATFSVERTGQWLGSWTPWHGFVTLPENVAYRLPAGTRIVADIHYRGASERVEDRGTLGVFFAKSPARESATDLVIDARANPSRSDASLNGRTRITADTTVWAIQPEIVAGLVVARGIGETTGRWNRCPAGPDRAFTRLADAVSAQDAEAAGPRQRTVRRRAIEDDAVRSDAGKD